MKSTITLCQAIDQYIEWQRDHGAKFQSSARALRHFSKTMGNGIRSDAVSDDAVLDYLAGKGPLTRTRANRYGVLTGFYRYAISRGYATRSPLPPAEKEPREPKSAPPYLYSRDEMQRLLDAVEVSRRHAFQLDGDTLRTLLLLLYGTGLRLGEALNLTIRDTDLSQAVLRVRNAKFYRNRLVPVGPRLTDFLKAYAARRVNRRLPLGQDSAFLANRDGSRLAQKTVQNAFANLLRTAGIRHTDKRRQSPRLHSMRHTFAVNRLNAWYRDGADVQRLLPVLSTYLGHIDLNGTQVYLTMTPELLQEASLRFQRYAQGGRHE